MQWLNKWCLMKGHSAQQSTVTYQEISVGLEVSIKYGNIVVLCETLKSLHTRGQVSNYSNELSYGDAE
jgi:hypothetical protein